MRTIILIDDNPDDVFCIAHAFKRNGVEVASYSHPEAALQDINTIEHDLILVDLHMPGIRGPAWKFSGAAICGQLRDQLEYRRPIVVLTGINQVNAVIGCLQNGADDFAVKSSDYDDVVERSLKLCDTYDPSTAKGQRMAYANILSNSVSTNSEISATNWREYCDAASANNAGH